VNRRQFPLLTLLTLGLSIVMTATRLLGDGPLDAVADPRRRGDPPGNR
jgi:hypothetical protein